MITPTPTHYEYRCDVCAALVDGDSADGPPAGFATIAVHPAGGVVRVAHLCVGDCLELGAENLADGRAADGRIVP